MLKKRILFLVSFVILIASFFQLTSKAQENTATERPNVKLTDIKLAAWNGVDTVKVSESFSLTANWDASEYGAELKEGDYFVVNFPDKVDFNHLEEQFRSFELRNQTNDVVAKAVITPNPATGGKIKITFTKWVENRNNVKGTFKLAAKFDAKAIKPEDKTIKLNFNIENGISYETNDVKLDQTGPVLRPNATFIEKGASGFDNFTKVKWFVTLNHEKTEITNAVLIDNLTGGKEGTFLNEDSFVLEEVETELISNRVVVKRVINPNVPIDGKLKINPDFKGFTLSLGDISGKTYRINYTTNYIVGRTVGNFAKLTGDQILQERTSYSGYNKSASGGTGEGDLTSKIKIIKVDKDDARIKLANVVFTVKNLTDQSTFELTTDQNGEVLSGKLTPGKYEIVEKTAPKGYALDTTPIIADVIADKPCIKEITNEAEKIDINVTKEWIGGEGNEAIIVLKADDKEVGKHTLTPGNWTYTFSKLRKYDKDSGNLIVYTVEEENVPTGYTVAYEKAGENNFVVKNKREAINITVTKTWEDTVAPLPAVSLQLYKNGQPEGQPVVLPATNTYSWENLDKINQENGQVNIYEVKEVGELNGSIQLDGSWYKVTYGGNQDNGFTINNKKLLKLTILEPPFKSIKVRKDWKTIGTEKPVNSIEVVLVKDGVETDQKLVLDENNGWSGEFKNLSVSETLNGKAFVYKVKEVGEDSGIINLNNREFDVVYTTEGDKTLVITNKEKAPWVPLIPSTRSIKVIKEWDVFTNKPVDKIEVELYKDGVATGEKIQLTEANNWMGEFKNLKVSETLGSEVIKYTVKEVGEDKGSIQLSGKMYKVSYSGSMKDGFKIVNKQEFSFNSTPITKETIEIKVLKEWDFIEDNKIFVEKIEVELYRDGIATGSILELNSGNNWQGSFKGLLVSDSNGKEFKYTIKELGETEGFIKIDGEDYKVIYSGTAANGLEIKNIQIASEINDEEVESDNYVPNKKNKTNNPTKNKKLAKTGNSNSKSISRNLAMVAGSILLAIIIKKKKSFN